MIKCKTCSKNFPRPQRRGRPPVQCDSCKGLKSDRGAEEATKRAYAARAKGRSRSPQKPSEPQGDTTTPAQAVSGLSVALRASKKAPYVSGYCNRRHAPEIHRLCGVSGCACGCHGAA